MAKVLIVDDEPLTTDMLSTLLNMIGHEPIAAHSGRQTWDKLAYEEPDLVLLDIMLPDDNGLNVCRQLRANELTKNIPVIMISAHYPPMEFEATQAGANGYLMKPIKFDKLKMMLVEFGIA
jgi:DNA-binding response OmpR family regulator